jgi:hypothetical protein
LSFFWEIPIMVITYLAGTILSSGMVSKFKRTGIEKL